MLTLSLAIDLRRIVPACSAFDNGSEANIANGVENDAWTGASNRFAQKEINAEVLPSRARKISTAEL